MTFNHTLCQQFWAQHRTAWTGKSIMSYLKGICQLKKSEDGRTRTLSSLLEPWPMSLSSPWSAAKHSHFLSFHLYPAGGMLRRLRNPAPQNEQLSQLWLTHVLLPPLKSILRPPLIPLTVNVIAPEDLRETDESTYAEW